MKAQVHDCSWNAFPKPRWRTLVYWPAVCPEYPALSARLVRDSWTEELRFVVTHWDGFYWSCPSVHPVEWGMTLQEEFASVAQFIRKAVSAVEKKSQVASAEARTWAAAHPALWEYLTCDAFDDGEQREVSMLLVFVEDGRFKVALQDRQEGRSLWVGSESISDALRTLEAHLKAGNGEWRQMRGQHAKKGKK